MGKIILCAEGFSKPMQDLIKEYISDNDTVYVLESEGEQFEHQKQAAYITVDRSDDESIKAAIAQIKENRLDMLVLSPGEVQKNDGSIRSGHDYEAMMEYCDKMVIGSVAVAEACIELLRAGNDKKIAVLSDLDHASINLSTHTDQFAYSMASAALHDAQQILFNRLRPEGFRFRCFAASETKGGISAGKYFKMQLSYDKDGDYIHSDENRLTMRNGYLQEIPW